MNSLSPTLSAASNTRRQRAGLTLVEMLVATTASLILFGAVMAIFNVLGTAVNNSRSMSELEGQLCVLATQVARDLTNATATRGVNGLAVMPPSGSAAGYFEIVEGPMGDLYDAGLTPRWPGSSYREDNVVGDVDDAIIFTCRSNGDPYRGRFGIITLEEPEAEVAYFCGNPVDNGDYLPTTYTLYRRQVLVSSTAIGNSPFDEEEGVAARWLDFEPDWDDNSDPDWDKFYSSYDLSVRFQAAVPDVSPAYLILNSMNELQRRSARLGHPIDATEHVKLPLPVPNDSPQQLMTPSTISSSVVSHDVLSFDVRVLDPQGRKADSTTGLSLLPSDQNYWQSAAASRGVVEPVYVDLGYNRFNIGGGDPATSVFSGDGESTSLAQSDRRTFDTWSTEEGPPPPYDVDGLAGIQVTIRLIDTRSKRIVQRTITHTF